MTDKRSKEDLEEVTRLYDDAIRALQRLEVNYKEPGMNVILPALKERRRNLRWLR